MSKYKNKKVEVDGIVFDSKKEAGFYQFLKDRLDAGEITDLRMQVRYEIIPAVYGERVKHLKTKDKTESYCIQKATYYVADFVYKIVDTGAEEVIDVKSFITRKNPVYRLKKKMMRAFNGIDIIEI